jgi:hypothetical protein
MFPLRGCAKTYWRMRKKENPIIMKRRVTFPPV